MKMLKELRAISILLALFLAAMMAVPTLSMAAEKKVDLGTTSTFAVLAGTTITNTGATTITGSTPEGGGNVGVHSGSEFTGQSSVEMTGWTAYLSDTAGVALQAKTDLGTAYDDASGRKPTETFDANDNQLGGKTLTSGVYAFGHAETANLTAASPLILDAEGNEEAVFIFQASSDLIMASDSKVILINGAKYCRVFWQVTSSATLGTNSTFVGHIFAMTSIAAQTGANVQGQLLAQDGAVTLDHNTIHNGLCVATPNQASLHVIKHVINDNGRTAVAANFNLHVKTSDHDVALSPAPGVESPGNTYTLAAGNYVVSEESFPGYTVSYSGDSDSSGNIILAPGDDKTVTIINNDTAGVVTAAVATTPGVTSTVPVTTTVTGGQLPNTSTPLYDILLLGAALTLGGALGWKNRKRFS
ncbi:MAG TPA: ice-binding family protein [Desulfosporosinus sp.]|nr:ice-binding family protein [Desulfosporosinus sp.]